MWEERTTNHAQFFSDIKRYLRLPVYMYRMLSGMLVVQAALSVGWMECHYCINGAIMDPYVFVNMIVLKLSTWSAVDNDFILLKW